MSKEIISNADSDWQWIENNFKFYGLKVRLKPEGNRIFIDVESSINTDQHYIQNSYNYLTSLTSYYITGSYNISSYQLFGILATAAEIKISPWTSEAGFWANSWKMIAVWLDRSIDGYTSVLRIFKEKYPECTKIILTTSSSSDHPLNVTVSDDGYIEGFNQLKINGAVIDLDLPIDV